MLGALTMECGGHRELSIQSYFYHSQSVRTALVFCGSLLFLMSGSLKFYCEVWMDIQDLKIKKNSNSGQQQCYIK